MREEINNFIDWLVEKKIVKDDDLKYYLDDYLKERKRNETTEHH